MEKDTQNKEGATAPDDEQVASDALLDCPFCGGKPERYVKNDILFVKCPQCVHVGLDLHRVSIWLSGRRGME